MDSVRKNIKDAIDARGLTYKEVSLKLDKNHSYIQQFLEREIPKTLKERDRMVLADLLGIHEADIGGVVRKSDKPTSRSGILSLDLNAGMGGGGVAEIIRRDDGTTEGSNGSWTMPDHILAMFPNTEQTFALPMIGDSMFPTIQSGSVGFVDTLQKKPREPDIFACDAGDGIVIKRIELIPRTDDLWVISDNEIYNNYRLPREDVHFYGRLVAWFQWRG